MLSHLEDIEVAINTFSAANGGFGKKHLMHACKVVAGVQVTLTHTERQRGRETQRKSDRETERQRQKDRQKDRQTERDTERQRQSTRASERERGRLSEKVVVVAGVAGHREQEGSHAAPSLYLVLTL